MTDTGDSLQCAIPGCRRDAQAPARGVEDHICSHHLSLAKAHLRERLETTARRFARIEAYWADEPAYDRIIASDRYFKLSNATCWAQENVDAAWARAKLSILAAEGAAGRDSVAGGGIAAFRASA
jgi:hypothetical protein